MRDRHYLGSSTVFWPTADGPWALDLHFADSGTGPICVGADLRAFTLSRDEETAHIQGDGTNLLTAEVWRSIPIKTLIAKEIAAFVDYYREMQGETIPDAADDRRTGPRLFWTGDRLRDVAAIYRANLGTGAPTRAVAEAFDVSPSMGAKLVARARAEGLLGATSKGKPGELPRKPKKKPPKRSPKKRSR